MANFFEWQRTRPVNPGLNQVGAVRDRQLPQIGWIADHRAAKPLYVERALARALDGGFERRIDVGISVRQRFLCYKAD